MRGVAPLLFAAALFRATNAQSTASFDEIFAAEQAHQLRFDPLNILYARIDPIMDPGVNNPSGHLHTIIGPNIFNSDSTSDQLRTGTCTSFNIGGTSLDMSAYVYYSSLYSLILI